MRNLYPETHSVTLRSFEQNEHKKLTIAEGMEGMITSMLTHFYLNPEYASAREVLANSWDACVEADVPIEIHVTIPRELSSTSEIVFKDYGIGMTPEIFKEVFAAYGESTKREKTDQQGFFGLGCKTPYTLSDTFTVVTERDGRKTLGIFTRNEEDFGVADFIDLGGEPGEHGTTITIPLKNTTPSKMEAAVRRAAFAMPPNSVFINDEPCQSIYDEGDKALNVNDKVFVVNKLAGSPLTTEWNVLMGGIIYPLDNINFNQVVSRWGSYYQYVIKVDIDDLLPTPQRDSIRDIKRNREKLESVYDALKQEVKNYVQDSLNSVTYPEAAHLYTKFGWAHSFHVDVVGSSTCLFSWHDKPINSSVPVTIPAFSKITNSRVDAIGYVTAQDYYNKLIIAYKGISVEDINKTKLKRHYNKILREHGGRIIILFLEDSDVYVSQWLAAGQDDNIPVYTYDDVFNAVIQRNAPTTPRVARPFKYNTVKYTQVSNDIQVVQNEYSIDELPEDIYYYSGNLGRYAKVFPELMLDKTFIVLKATQKESAMFRKVPRIHDMREELETALTTMIEETCTPEFIEDYNRFSMMSNHFMSLLRELSPHCELRKSVQAYDNAHNVQNEQYQKYVLLIGMFRSDSRIANILNVRNDNFEALSTKYPLLAPYARAYGQPRDIQHVEKYVRMCELDAEDN